MGEKEKEKSVMGKGSCYMKNDYVPRETRGTWGKMPRKFIRIGEYIVVGLKWKGPAKICETRVEGWG